MELVPAAAFPIVLLLIPESPRFGMLIRRRGLAIEVLASIGGPAVAVRKVEEIAASVADGGHRPCLANLRDKSSGRVRRIVWVGLWLAILQQLVGINVVFYYGAVPWQSVGFTERDALAITPLGGGLSIAAVTLTILLIDRIGRRRILLFGSIGMAIGLAALTYAFTEATVGESGTLNGARTSRLRYPSRSCWQVLGSPAPTASTRSAPAFRSGSSLRWCRRRVESSAST